MSVTSSSVLTDFPVYPATEASATNGGSSSGTVVNDYCFDDNCSICLEPYTSQNPSTVTNCKHEYHLQCILEWSQRSQECPVCWQLLSLKDADAQELLAAVEAERRLRSRNNVSSASSALSNQAHFHAEFDVEQDSYSDDSDFEERIRQHIAAVARRARRERQRFSREDSPRPNLSVSSADNSPTDWHVHAPPESQSVGFSLHDSGTPVMASQPLLSGDVAVSRDASATSKPRVFFGMPSNDAPQAPSEGLSLSDAIKSKWFAASARYKESISKGTRGLKEKILSHNSSVKELSKGVQREMSAGIAGVARMIEKLDLTPKRTGPSSPVADCRAGTSDISLKGKSMQENINAQTLDQKNEELTHAGSLESSLHVSALLPLSGQIGVHTQIHH